MHSHHHRRSISKEEINSLPRKHYTGAIHIVDSDEKMHAAARALATEKVLGFDTETRPAFKVGESYPPSIVQLAASDGVYIFQLKHIRSYKALSDIMADNGRLKAGIAIRDDIVKLNSLFSFKPRSFVELAQMSARLGIKNAGLRGLAALLFGFRISKHAKISRWDTDKLGHDQVIYAATDAWICREIYFTLLGMLRGISRPPRP